MQLNYKLTETLGLKYFEAQPDLLIGTNNTALGYLWKKKTNNSYVYNSLHMISWAQLEIHVNTFTHFFQ